MHHITAAYEKVHSIYSYVTPLDQRVWLGSKPRASQCQMDDHADSSWWNSGNVNCGCKSVCSTTSYPGFSLCWPWYEVGCSTRRCACQEAELKCTGLCSCCEFTNFTDQNTDENNLSDDDNDGGLLFELDGDMMTQDSMAYLKEQ
jgi:hypothetical protein